MSSMHRVPSETEQGNDFYVNVTNISTIAGATGDLYAYNEAAPSMTATDLTAVFGADHVAPGGLLVKDFGKTVRLSDAVYRKAQLYTVDGTGDVSKTFYIRLNPDSGLVGEWARMNIASNVIAQYGNDFFVNVSAITNGQDTYNESGAAAGVTGLAGPYAAGSLLVRDMGKTVTVSGAKYRKVQTVSLDGADASYNTFYILLNPASGSICKWASMTLQA